MHDSIRCSHSFHKHTYKAQEWCRKNSNSNTPTKKFCRIITNFIGAWMLPGFEYYHLNLNLDFFMDLVSIWEEPITLACSCSWMVLAGSISITIRHSTTKCEVDISRNPQNTFWKRYARPDSVYPTSPLTWWGNLTWREPCRSYVYNIY